MVWSMRYSIHHGYEPPALRPQFLATVGTDDPAAHIRYAASIGMSGILYPWAMEKPATERDRVKEALLETGLTASAIVAIPAEFVVSPILADRSPENRQRLAQFVKRSSEVAAALQSSTLAVLIAADPAILSEDEQYENVAANLAEMAAISGDHGIVIGIEPIVALPGLLLRSTQDTLKLIRMAASPSVGMIFDTGHIAQMGEDLVQSLNEAIDQVCLLQLADQPGRVEPGAGELDLVEVAALAVRRGYNALVDLEHGWTSPSAEGEAAGLDRLREFDAELQRNLAAFHNDGPSG
ncbi:hydroxypyruvate isomerase [Sphingobium xenophagum]|uniref:Hydroxypyruvate isomerase n=1 Tax=Sphingobium xenophagum TaxID=121428 RepID=A0ABU1X7H0_SPHXE|nr:sugar phosphate isomerase/epimerase family protein [Sphingobium xenophagum]MDR7157239.1 hydroxypyruvate isomerase [Sphingobium xenophagum]